MPELYRAFAARSQRYKLVQPLGIARPLPEEPTFKLYDMVQDPLEMMDIAADKPGMVARMRRGYEAWFKDVSSTRGYAPPRILGRPPAESDDADTAGLARAAGRLGAESLGHWEVQVARPGRYTITLRFAPLETDGKALFALAGVTKEQELKSGATRCVLEGVTLKEGPGRLEAWLAEAKGTKGVQYVDIERAER